MTMSAVAATTPAKNVIRVAPEYRAARLASGVMTASATADRTAPISQKANYHVALWVITFKKQRANFGRTLGPRRVISNRSKPRRQSRHVRFAPIASEIRHRIEMTRGAKTGSRSALIQLPGQMSELGS